MEFNEGLVKLDARAKLATFMLWLFVAVSVVAALSQGLEASAMIDLETGTGLLVSVALLSYFVYTLVFLACVGVVARWIYRAHANLRDAGIGDLDFSPGWAIGWYFVPIANLVMPFHATRELWHASRGMEHQFASEAPFEVKAWWAAWIVGSILSAVSFWILSLGEGDPSSLTSGNAVNAAGTVITLLSAVLLVKVIEAITRSQRSGSTAAGVFA